MHKKGQVTIFVIISIFIVIGVVLFFTLGGANWIYSFNDEQANDIKNNVDNCLKENLIEGLYFVSLQGGYYYLPNSSIKITDYSVPIYFEKGIKYYLPTKDLIGEQIGFYLDNNVLECIITYLNSSVYNLEYENIGQESRILISDYEISVDFSYLIKLNHNNKEILFKKFHSSIDFNFKDRHDLINSFNKIIQDSLNYVPEGKIMDFSLNNNLTYNVFYLPDNSVVYQLIFQNSSELKKPYVFSIGAKYDW
jgi:hypothetical protein